MVRLIKPDGMATVPLPTIPPYVPTKRVTTMTTSDRITEIRERLRQLETGGTNISVIKEAGKLIDELAPATLTWTTPIVGSKWVWEPHKRVMLSIIEVIEISWSGESWQIHIRPPTDPAEGGTWIGLDRFIEAVGSPQKTNWTSRAVRMGFHYKATWDQPEAPEETS